VTAPSLTATTEALFAAPAKTPAGVLPLAPAGPAPGREGGPEARPEKPRPAGVPIPHCIGIDPSLTGAGVASSHGWCETRGYVKTRSKDPGITQLPYPQRLAALVDLARGIVELVGRPDLVVMEAPAFSRSGGGAHERSWMWWELYRALTSRDVPVAVMSIQARLMYATGKGSGSKGAVIDAASRRWPQFDTGGNDNLADAVVFAMAGMDWLGHPLTVMPTGHRKALDTVAWPEIGRWAA
jgi:Holliday junction resolvasome RuvABC endonuclease subunit